jgi:hypothetical protein
MGLIGQAFEFIGDSLQRQGISARLGVLDHAEVLLDTYYPNIPETTPIVQTESHTYSDSINTNPVAEVVQLRPPETTTNLERIHNELDQIYQDAA